MAREVVEVIARFGDTILDVAHIGASDTYRIGTAPDVNLAVQGHTSFPLVDGGVVRWPVGVSAHEHGGTTELHVGGVTFVLTRCKLPAAALDRPRFERRPVGFVLASLLVHLGVWLVAIILEPFERVVTFHPPRMRYVHVDTTPEPEPKPTPKPPAPAHSEPQQEQQPDPAAAQPRKRSVAGAERASAAERVGNIAQTARDIADIVANTKVVERVGALKPEDNFTEDDTYTNGFGGSRRMGPGETIKTAEGYNLMLYDVKLCPARSCTLSGPIPASFVRAQLHEHMAAIYACYSEHADGPGTVVLEFTIKGDGSVVNARGSGLGDTGPCVARVLPGIYFKAIGDNDVRGGGQKETFVRYPVRFN